MTDKELGAKIAKVFYDFDDRPVFDEDKYKHNVDQVLTLFKKAGYVKLCKDQSLPSSCKIYRREIADILEAGWRKVESLK